MTDTRTNLWHGAILAIFVPAMLYTLLSSTVPYSYYSPDVGYVIAKVRAIGRGHWFTDPISGSSTFHPIGMHLILWFFSALGVSLKTLLFSVSVVVYASIAGFGYLILRRAYSPTVALLAILFSPFAIQHAIGLQILLPTAWNLSIPFYLAGLWLALSGRSTLSAFGTAALWGMAFLISPVNVFLIGVYFLWELFRHRDRYTGVLIVTFLVVITPLTLAHVLAVIRDVGYYRQETFSVLPNWTNPLTIVTDYLRAEHAGLNTSETIAHIVLVALFLGAALLRRRIHWYLFLALVVYVLTYLHFSNGYAMRIQPLITLFMSAVIFDAVLSLPQGLWIGVVLAALGLGLGVRTHFAAVAEILTSGERAAVTTTEFAPMLDELAKYVRPDDMILCDKPVYRILIMPNLPVRGLGCHGTLAYFQVKEEIAGEFEADYVTMTTSTYLHRLEEVVQRRNIRIVLLWRRGELAQSFALHQMLANSWRQVYGRGEFTLWTRAGRGDVDVLP